MKRLLPVFLAVLAFGCSDSTSPGTTSPHKIPKVGSTFTFRHTYGAQEKTETDTVMVTGLRFDGKSNVIMMTDSGRFAFEDNGDISIPDRDRWIRIPVTSKRDTVTHSSIDLSGLGDVVTIDEQVNFLGEKTRSYNGTNYETLRFEIRRINKYYNRDGTFASTLTEVDLVTWIPEIGYYSYYAHNTQEPTYLASDLIAFTLK